MGALQKTPSVLSHSPQAMIALKKKSQFVGDSRISESKDIQSISPFFSETKVRNFEFAD